jgi:hypothetical protein
VSIDKYYYGGMTYSYDDELASYKAKYNPAWSTAQAEANAKLQTYVCHPFVALVRLKYNMEALS